MGQYHYVINRTKKQFLHPHRLGDGLKLMEFVGSRDGTISALALLLACSNGRGGGDFRGEDPDGLVGSWAGDSIAIVGDYFRAEDMPDYPLDLDWEDHFEDISPRIRKVMEGSGMFQMTRSWAFEDNPEDKGQGW